MMKQTDNSHTPQVSVAVIDNYDSFTMQNPDAEFTI